MWQEIQDLKPAQQRDALLDMVPAIIDKYADVSSTSAAEWYDRMRAKWFGEDGFEATSETRKDDLYKLIRAKAGVLWGDDPEEMLRYLNGVVDKGVRRGGHDTIVRNARRDPRKPRYARVPSGAKTCAFCAMLASRGFVYSSAETAGAMNKYHPDCSCEIVPSWDKKPKVEGYDPEALYKGYKEAREKAGEDPTEEQILAAMRSEPGRYTDGVLLPIPKGWKQPHAPDENRLLSLRDAGDVTDGEWYRRQEQIGVPHTLDTLYPQEIVFLERFKSLGNEFQWIPRSKDGKPSNDFVWMNHGEAKTELKSPASMVYRNVANRINDAVTKALEQGVIKDVFSIDFGDSASMPDKFIHQISAYNLKHDHKIKELWIWDKSGFNRMTLKEE